MFSNWCHSRFKAETVSYTWKISNVSIFEKASTQLKSSTFASNSHSSHRWHLSLKFNPTPPTTLQIVLLLNPSGDRNPDLLWVKSKCAILNTREEEIFQQNNKPLSFDQGINSAVSAACKDSDSSFVLHMPSEELFRPENEYISQDELTLYFEVTYTDALAQPINIHSDLIDDIKDDLCRSIARMYLSADVSDVTLSVGHKSYPAHKVILSARSPVFRTMFQHNMVENTLNRVEIKDMDNSIFEKTLKFIYSDELPIDLDKVATDLLVAADRYSIAKLKLACETEILRNLSVKNAVDTLKLANLHSFDTLKTKIIEFVVANATAVMNTKKWDEVKNTDLVEQICNILVSKDEQIAK